MPLYIHSSPLHSLTHNLIYLTLLLHIGTATTCRYDQSTYFNRLKHMWEICGPASWRTLLTTDDELNRAIELIDSYKKGTLKEEVTEEQLWSAKQIKDTIIHPDSGEKIPLPFRMSCHVLANTILLLGMLSASNVATNVFWQFANQSFNAA
jgi:hypothetical protein